MQHSNPLRTPVSEPDYWHGNINKLIRYNFYLQTGANVFNVYKYVGATIIGVYWVLHLKNHWVLLAMFLAAVPILALIGYFSIHHVNKVMDWLNVKFGSHYGIYQIKLLEDIRDAIKNTN